MKIIHIVPGSGGTFYCQNCMRDGALVQALRRQGEDVVMMPMYLPMFTDGDPVQGDAPVFFGGINVWLQQQFSFFRKTPRWLDRVFDAKWMLKRAAKMEGSTSAAELGPMTLSMLEGSAGHQRKEVARLIDWLIEHEQPDVVHLSNILLIGLAPELKARLKVPILCSLQDEDGWLDSIEAPFNAACWEAIRARTQDIDRFVAVSHWFANRMSERLNLSLDRIDVVHIGIDLTGYSQASLDFDPPVLGYLSRMNAELGLERLVDAFIDLKKESALKTLQLKAMGGAVGDDEKCMSRLRKKLERAGVADDVEFLRDFSREHRLAFLQSLTVMSVPAENGEAFGTYMIESMAAGVPVVQPNAGAFPEVVDATGGGVIYTDLTETLRHLFTHPEDVRKLGSAGRESVVVHFSVETMAKRMVSVYEQVLQP